MFSALLEYALVNYASRSDAQRLAKKKHQKQWELDHCAFDPEQMEDIPPPPPGAGPIPGAPANNGGSFAMVNLKKCFLLSPLHFAPITSDVVLSRLAYKRVPFFVDLSKEAVFFLSILPLFSWPKEDTLDRFWVISQRPKKGWRTFWEASGKKSSFLWGFLSSCGKEEKSFFSSNCLWFVNHSFLYPGFSNPYFGVPKIF